MAETVTVNSGMLLNAADTEALILIGSENVITADIAGIFMPAVEEGQRVRKGEVIGGLISSAISAVDQGRPLLAQSTGLVCFHIDGNEGLMTRDNWEQLDLAQLPQKDPGQTVPLGNWVDAGRPLAKILDNLSNPMLGLEFGKKTIADTPGLEAVEVGQTLRVKLLDKEPQTVKVVSIQQDAEKIRMAVQLDGFREDLIHLRRTPATLIVNQWKGFIVPREALVMREGVPGLYLLRKGWTRWKSVELVGETETQIVVKGLEEGDIVVTNPGLVKEGVRLH
jgi:putative membrane fusion protein